MTKILVVIPHYNHHATLRAVAQAAAAQGADVAVFDDGSKENPQPLLEGLPVSFIRFEQNRGKGFILKEAAAWAARRGYTHILTVDSDGQHNPAEIPSFLAAAAQYPEDLILGVRQFDKTVPFSSRFGRKFGGFWVRVQTGVRVEDIQSGFRCYPVEIINTLPVWSVRYAFEVEIVVRALWAGFSVREIPVSVSYPENRVSHFHKLKDNARLTVLNTLLTLRSMLPFPHRRYVKDENGAWAPKTYQQLWAENVRDFSQISRNAFSAAWGIFCGSIALPGIRQVFLFWGAGWWNLNRMFTISFEKFCIGPIVPALCIEAGFFMRHGRFLTEFNLTTLGRQFLSRVWDWVLGSLVVAPLLAGLAFLIVWGIGFFLYKRSVAHARS